LQVEHYAAAAIGHRVPPYHVGGDRPIDRSLARIGHRFLTEIAVEARLSRLGLRALALCQQAVAYASGAASAASN
jgi:hypothetical protein